MTANLKLNRRSFLSGFAAVSLTAGFPEVAATAWNPSMSGLNAQLSAQGRFFGAAVRSSQLEENPNLKRAFLQNCGSMTPEIDLKWAAIEWNHGEYNFGPVDELLEVAEANNISVHGHTLLWGQSVPPWALAHMDENPNDWDVVAKYLGDVLTRYGAKITRWDLVNEVIDTSENDDLRRNVFYKSFGPSYIQRALSDARSHAPNAKFILNDFSLEYDNVVDEARRKAVLKLLERLQRSGTGFDGLGMQAHLDLSKGNVRRQTLKPFLSAASDLGLEIYISELDVQEADLTGPQATRDKRVSDEVRRFLDIVLECPNVKGITSWGLSDDQSWLNSKEYKRHDVKGASSNKNRGLPFDGSMRPKDFYYAMNSSFSGARVG